MSKGKLLIHLFKTQLQESPRKVSKDHFVELGTVFQLVRWFLEVIYSQRCALSHPFSDCSLCVCRFFSHLKGFAFPGLKWLNICIPSIFSKRDSLSGAKSSLLNISHGILSQYKLNIWELFQLYIPLPKSISHEHVTQFVYTHLFFFFFNDLRELTEIQAYLVLLCFALIAFHR